MSCLINVGDLCEIVLEGQQMNTRISHIRENIVKLVRPKTQQHLHIIWNGIEWRTEDERKVDSVKFMKSAKKSLAEKFPVVDFPTHIQYELLANARPEEFLTMCSMSEFAEFCVNDRYMVSRLYRDKLQRDIRQDILKLGNEYTEGNEEITWNEFYKSLYEVQTFINTIKDETLAQSMLDAMALQNKTLQFKIISMLTPFHPAISALDTLAFRHRYKLLRFLYDNGKLDWTANIPDLDQSAKYFYRWLIQQNRT